MRRVWWHICGRYWEARAEEAARNALIFADRARAYFSRLAP